MALFTTYLAAIEYFKAERQVYFVMRNRGNNQVAPERELLDDYKNGKITWEQYAKRYTEFIQTNPDAIAWIDRVAENALLGDVLLVCFEKDQNRCHRSLLAIQIAFRHPEVNYVGDLHPFDMQFSTNNRQEMKP
jgi:uncharacterized protein YeaO (DUF488 family)